MRNKPKIVKSEIVAKSRLFQIEQIDLHFANGEQRVYERIRGRRRGAVMIIPMLDDETVILIREYAAGIDGYNLCLPKGLMEEGEDIFQAANREMMEEIGYGAHELTELKAMAGAPGYMQGKMALVLAKNLYEKRLPGDEPEEIEVIPWKLYDLNKLLEREDFTEARSIAALYMVRDLLAQNCERQRADH